MRWQEPPIKTPEQQPDIPITVQPNMWEMSKSLFKGFPPPDPNDLIDVPMDRYAVAREYLHKKAEGTAWGNYLDQSMKPLENSLKIIVGSLQATSNMAYYLASKSPAQPFKDPRNTANITRPDKFNSIVDAAVSGWNGTKKAGVYQTASALLYGDQQTQEFRDRVLATGGATKFGYRINEWFGDNIIGFAPIPGVGLAKQALGISTYKDVRLAGGLINPAGGIVKPTARELSFNYKNINLQKDFLGNTLEAQNMGITDPEEAMAYAMQKTFGKTIKPAPLPVDDAVIMKIRNDLKGAENEITNIQRRQIESKMHHGIIAEADMNVPKVYGVIGRKDWSQVIQPQQIDKNRIVNIEDIIPQVKSPLSGNDMEYVNVANTTIENARQRVKDLGGANPHVDAEEYIKFNNDMRRTPEWTEPMIKEYLNPGSDPLIKKYNDWVENHRTRIIFRGEPDKGKIQQVEFTNTSGNILLGRNAGGVFFTEEPAVAATYRDNAARHGPAIIRYAYKPDMSKVWDLNNLTEEQLRKFGIKDEVAIKDYIEKVKYYKNNKELDNLNHYDKQVIEMEDTLVYDDMNNATKERIFGPNFHTGEAEAFSNRVNESINALINMDIPNYKDLDKGVLIEEIDRYFRHNQYTIGDRALERIAMELKNPGSDKELARYNKVMEKINGVDPLKGMSQEDVALYTEVKRTVDTEAYDINDPHDVNLLKVKYTLDPKVFDEVIKELKNPGSVPELKKIQQHADWLCNKKSPEVYVSEQMTEKLRKMGYDWWAHTGGIRVGTGEDPHKVFVALKNKAMVEIQEIRDKDIAANIGKYEERFKPIKLGKDEVKNKVRMDKKIDAIVNKWDNFSKDNKILSQRGDRSKETEYVLASKLYGQAYGKVMDEWDIPSGNTVTKIYEPKEIALAEELADLGDRIIDGNLKDITPAQYDKLKFFVEDTIDKNNAVSYTEPNKKLQAILDSAETMAPTMPKIDTSPRIEVNTDYQKAVNERARIKADYEAYDKAVVESKVRDEVISQQRVAADVKKAELEARLKLAEKGELFTDEVGRNRTVRTSYIDAVKKELSKPNASLSGFTGDQWLEVMDSIVFHSSGGRTHDIGQLTQEEFMECFDSIDMMRKVPLAAKNVGGNNIIMFGSGIQKEGLGDVLASILSNTRFVLKRYGADRLLDIGYDASMTVNRARHGYKQEWGTHLKELGIPTWRNISNIAKPGADGVTRRHPKGDLLRMTFLKADGIDPFDITQSQRTDVFQLATMGGKKGLQTDELDFIKETHAKVRSGEITQEQINAVNNAASFIHRSGDELRALGERLGYLYDTDKTPMANGLLPKYRYFTEEELVKRKAVSSRSHYITHKIDQSVEEATAGSNRIPYDALSFFAKKSDGTSITIDEMKNRAGVREGLVQNADTAFRAMVNHETYLYHMEPAFESTKDIARIVDRIRDPSLWNITDPEKAIGVIERHLFGGANEIAGGVVGYSVRGRKGSIESGVDRVFNTKQFRWVADKTVDIMNIPFEKFNTMFRVPQIAKDFKTITGHYRRYVYGAAMGMNPPSVVKNSFQSLLTLPIIGTRATIQGMAGVWHGHRGGDNSILNKSNMMIERGIHPNEISPDGLTKVENASSYFFRVGEKYVNVAPAYMGSLWKAITKDPNNMRILANYGVTKKSGKQFWDGVRNAMNNGEFRAESRVADYVAELTQFSYGPWEMPKAMWSPQAKTFGQFLTWPLNYAGTYLPTMWGWMMKGEGPFGKMNWWERNALLKHLVLAEGIVMTAEHFNINLSFISPLHAPITAIKNTREGKESNEWMQSPWVSGFSPAMKTVQSIVNDWYLPPVEGNRITKKRILAPIRNALLINPNPKTLPQALAPGSLLKSSVKVMEGDKELTPLSIMGLEPQSKTKPRGRTRRR